MSLLHRLPLADTMVRRRDVLADVGKGKGKAEVPATEPPSCVGWGGRARRRQRGAPFYAPDLTQPIRNLALNWCRTGCRMSPVWLLTMVWPRACKSSSQIEAEVDQGDDSDHEKVRRVCACVLAPHMRAGVQMSWSVFDPHDSSSHVGQPVKKGRRRTRPLRRRDSRECFDGLVVFSQTVKTTKFAS